MEQDVLQINNMRIDAYNKQISAANELLAKNPNDNKAQEAKAAATTGLMQATMHDAGLRAAYVSDKALKVENVKQVGLDKRAEEANARAIQVAGMQVAGRENVASLKNENKESSIGFETWVDPSTMNLPPGKQVTKTLRKGEPPPDGWVPWSKPQAQTKPPAGYRFTESGDQEIIPGGPADVKEQIRISTDVAARDSMQAELDRLGKAANEVLKHPGLGGITGLRGAIPNIPGTDAADAEALLGTLKSQVAFSVLQAMRNNSKSGGALGQVSDKEGQLLQDNLSALAKSQSLKAYKQNLQKIVDFTEGSKERIRTAFEIKYGRGGTNNETNLPPEAVAKLKEGVVVTFGNGEKWTLENGKPKQVQ
jgi:hypothetical protein